MVADVCAWITDQLSPRTVTSDELLFEHQESQSNFALPVIYQPFDPAKKTHWYDRGMVLDFVESTGGGYILDFGPGDGWPALLMAPVVHSVVGVDASQRRVCVCNQNAERLGVANFTAIHVPAGDRLPFPDASFDGVVAAHSVELTPDIRAVLRELYRVLKPGGRLRIVYESLEPYRGGRLEDAWVWASGEATTYLVLCQRIPDEQKVLYFALQLQVSPDRVRSLISADGGRPTPDALTAARLDHLRPLITDALTCTLRQPDCRTVSAWLRDAGFHSVVPTHSGGPVAAKLFDRLTPHERPRNLDDLDRLLRPLIGASVSLEAPEHLQCPITAVR